MFKGRTSPAVEKCGRFSAARSPSLRIRCFDLPWRLVAEGQLHGVPIAAVLTPSEALQSDHLDAVGALADVDLAEGVSARGPVGYWSVDGERAGFRSAAPAVGFGESHWQTERFDPTPVGPVGELPLEGIRVIDLGIIVAGGELSRLFGDLGAEVIKVESAAYPDGLRLA